MSAESLAAQPMRSIEQLKALVRVRANHKNAESDILGMLVESGAVLQGHFRLESGQHSGILLRFESVTGLRKNVESIAGKLIADLKQDRIGFDAVLMQEQAGRSLGEKIATRLGKRMIFVETDEHNRPTMKLINDTTLYRGDRVLIVSDLSTSGSGLRTMTKLVRQKKGAPVAVALFAARNKDEMSAFEHEEHVKVYALADLAFEGSTYGQPGVAVDQAECEECKKGMPQVDSWEV